MELALDGWFGVVVWQNNEGRPHLLAAERFEKDP